MVVAVDLNFNSKTLLRKIPLGKQTAETLIFKFSWASLYLGTEKSTKKSLTICHPSPRLECQLYVQLMLVFHDLHENVLIITHYSLASIQRLCTNYIFFRLPLNTVRRWAYFVYILMGLSSTNLALILR